MRRFAGMLVGMALGLNAAAAGSPERDAAWDQAVEAAKSRGGIETKLDKASSYVFQRPDGSYLTLTQPLKAQAGRSVCLIAKDENSTACVDWDSGKLTLGDRADPATPWRFRSFASLDAFEAQQPGMFDKLFSTLGDMLLLKGKHGRDRGSGGYWRSENGRYEYVRPYSSWSSN